MAVRVTPVVVILCACTSSANGADTHEPDDANVVEAGGAAAWSVVASPTSGTLRAVWAHAGDVWICEADDVEIGGTTGKVLRRNGARFDVLVPNGGSATAGCTGVWGSASNDVWFVGIEREARLHFDGATLSSQPGMDDRTPLAIWGADASHVFAVGTNVLDEWDGARWHRLTSSGIDAASISGASTDDVFTVGPSLTHWQGATATPIRADLPQFAGVFAAAANDVFVVGVGGTIARLDGSTLLPMSSPATTTLHSVWGSSASDVWAVGDGGAIVHYDGTSWSTTTSPTTNDLLSVWGDTTTGDVWAVGANGTIAHARR